MKTMTVVTEIFSADENAQIGRKRVELQALLRFVNRAYIFCLCKGRLIEAEELLRMYRSFEEIDFSVLFKNME